MTNVTVIVIVNVAHYTPVADVADGLIVRRAAITD